MQSFVCQCLPPQKYTIFYSFEIRERTKSYIFLVFKDFCIFLTFFVKFLKLFKVTRLRFKVQGSRFQVWFTVYPSIFVVVLEETWKELGRNLEEGWKKVESEVSGFRFQVVSGFGFQVVHT